MYPPGTGVQVPPRSGALAPSRAAALVQRPAHNRSRGFGKSITLQLRCVALPPEFRTGLSPPHERGQTGLIALSDLPGEPAAQRFPITGPPLSGGPDTPR